MVRDISGWSEAELRAKMSNAAMPLDIPNISNMGTSSIDRGSFTDAQMDKFMENLNQQKK